MVPAWTMRLYLRAACHHLLALFDVHARGLLDINVFAGFAGFDGHVGVPVVGSRDADGIDRFIGDDLAEIFYQLGCESLLFGRGFVPLEGRLINVAQRDRHDFRHLHAVADVACAHGAQADVADRDTVVGPFHVAGEK